jgi:hypothetical protein
MPTVSRGLPERPHLEVPKREARELLDQWRQGERPAWERIAARLPKFRVKDAAAFAALPFRLADAQCVIAREYGFASWPALKRRIEVHHPAGALQEAIHGDDRETVVRLLTLHPDLLHLPLWSGNWGPPMSHAANVGRLEIVQAIAALGARDFQHAFDRAILQGKIECARWLHAQGAKLVPGIVMGACETLNLDGLRFLAEAGAPFTDHRGDRLAPLAAVVGTYGRHPARKHAALALLAERGHDLPETPMVALHRGDIAALESHLRRDPRLFGRRFALPEIYPPELGFPNAGQPGMHWTPIGGTTLLHLAIDFREAKVFAWLLEQGADVNARADIDGDGFGGHTPLFHTVVNGQHRTGTMTRLLLERGADPALRANVRKFLDWCEEPRWHEARDVTAAEWGRGFPDQDWVNPAALRLLET